MARKPTELRPLMTRIPEGLRRRLEKEAARNDRSMNAEIIHRLTESFAKADHLEDLLIAIFGNVQNVGLFREFAGVIATAEAEHGKKWREDVATRRSVEDGMRSIMLRVAEPDRFREMMEASDNYAPVAQAS